MCNPHYFSGYVSWKMFEEKQLKMIWERCTQYPLKTSRNIRKEKDVGFCPLSHICMAACFLNGATNCACWHWIWYIAITTTILWVKQQSIKSQGQEAANYWVSKPSLIFSENKPHVLSIVFSSIALHKYQVYWVSHVFPHN